MISNSNYSPKIFLNDFQLNFSLKLFSRNHVFQIGMQNNFCNFHPIDLKFKL